jgi:polyisoprenoid-binding protein YceI
MLELPTVYTISPSKDSTLAVEVLTSSLTGSRKKYTLFFENFSGQVSMLADDVSTSQLLLTVDAASIVCRDPRISEKKRRTIAEFAREDALAAKDHPKIQYTSTCIRAKALWGFVATGVLQIRGTTRELNVNMTWSPKRNHEFQLDGDATLRLSDFGLPRPSLMFGLIRTTDEVMVHLLLWTAAHPIPL